MSNKTEIPQEVEKSIRERATFIANNLINPEKNEIGWRRTYNRFVEGAEYGYRLALSCSTAAPVEEKPNSGVEAENAQPPSSEAVGGDNNEYDELWCELLDLLQFKFDSRYHFAERLKYGKEAKELFLSAIKKLKAEKDSLRGRVKELELKIDSDGFLIKEDLAEIQRLQSELAALKASPVVEECYVPVKVEDRLPEDKEVYVHTLIAGKVPCGNKPKNFKKVGVTHWLEKRDAPGAGVEKGGEAV